MLIGTFCTFSARFCAVTVIVSSVALLASGGVAAGAGGVAGGVWAAVSAGVAGSCVPLASWANALVLAARQIAAASGSRRRRKGRFFACLVRCMARSPMMDVTRCGL